MKKQYPLAVLLFFYCATAFAQVKLKDVQPAAVWVPAGLKVDGNLKEWNDTFQAYNKSTRLYYTLSNDANNIYLAIKSTDATNNAKIAAGGITLTVNTDGKKKDKDAFVLTYPVINRAAGGGQGGRRGGGRNALASDSASVAAAHQQFVLSAKEIKVVGFTSVEDTLISIYNEYGIKAAIGYDAQGSFTYELAVPLKMLGLSSGDTKEIAYNIKLNGLQIAARNDDGGGFVGGGGFGGGGGRSRGGNGGGGGNGGARSAIDFAELASPSDFWAKYSLATK